MAKQERRSRFLRVAFVWNGTLQAETLLEEPAPVVLGEDPSCLFPLPADVAPEANQTVIEPDGEGYRLVVAPHMGGDVWLRGQRTGIKELAQRMRTVPIGRDDYGVVSVGSVSVFFQEVDSPDEIARQPLAIDASTVASIGLSAFLAVALLLFFFMAKKEAPPRDDLALSADLIATFLVTPPPESIIEELKKNSGTETKDPGLQDRDEAGGKRAKKNEGKVGKENALQEKTEVAGERSDEVAARVRDQGLLGALSGGGEGNAIAEALDVPDLNDVLGGLGDAATITGKGSGGMGLRGKGSGGGGDAAGGLFAAGSVGTGSGAGKGKGHGRGKGGVGARGPKKERKISVSSGKPKVNGYLSPEQIARVVRANKAAIRYCYEVELQRQRSLRGRVEISWRINLSGTVASARVAKSTLRNAKVEGCMVRQVRRWRFPKPDGGEVKVNWPFIFGVQ